MLLLLVSFLAVTCFTSSEAQSIFTIKASHLLPRTIPFSSVEASVRSNSQQLHPRGQSSIPKKNSLGSASARRTSPSGSARSQPRNPRNASPESMQVARPSSPSASTSASKSSTSGEEWVPPGRELSGDWNRSPMARRGSAAQRMSPESPKSSPKRSVTRGLSTSRSASLDSAGYLASKSASPPRDTRDTLSSAVEAEQPGSAKRKSTTRSPSPESFRQARTNSYDNIVFPLSVGSPGPPLSGGSPGPSDPSRMRRVHDDFQFSRDASPIQSSPPRSPFPLRLNIDVAEINAAIRRSASGRTLEPGPRDPIHRVPDSGRMSRRDSDSIMAAGLWPRTAGFPRSRSASPSRSQPHLDPAELQRLSGQPHWYFNARGQQGGNRNTVEPRIQMPAVPATDDRLPLELSRPQRAPLMGVANPANPAPIVQQSFATSPQPNGGVIWSSANSSPVQSRPGTPGAGSLNAQKPATRR